MMRSQTISVYYQGKLRVFKSADVSAIRCRQKISVSHGFASSRPSDSSSSASDLVTRRPADRTASSDLGILKDGVQRHVESTRPVR